MQDSRESWRVRYNRYQRRKSREQEEKTVCFSFYSVQSKGRKKIKKKITFTMFEGGARRRKKVSLVQRMDGSYITPKYLERVK